MLNPAQEILGSAATADWGGWLKPAVYFLAACLCVYLGNSQKFTQPASHLIQKTWMRLAPLYLLIAASTVLGGDVLWISWARAFSNAHHVYEFRHYFQFTLLLATVLIGSALLQRHRSGLQHRKNTPADIAQTMVRAGACGTAILYLLRYVSFHYTDLALNAVWWDLRAGTWLELSSLGLFGLGALIELFRSYSHV